MSKKKGLSYDEKRVRLEELFHETRDVFTLKQLEKIASKQKGIVLQTVKEILQSLVDDDLVCGDKIGTQNFFWSFPSQALIVRENKIRALKSELAALQERKIRLESEKALATQGKEESRTRLERLAVLAQLEEENRKLREDCSQYASMDPDFLDDMEKDIRDAVNCTNRWTDNIFAIRSHCQKALGMETEKFNGFFQISDDFDYLELEKPKPKK